MADIPQPQPEKSHPTALAGDNVHERPEVKPLVEKAKAEPHQRVPQGTMRTGADVAGGGGTKPLEMPEDEPQSPPEPPESKD